MLAEFLSYEQLIHLFPSFFAILLCLFSAWDHLWINAKVRSEATLGSPLDENDIPTVQAIANGAAALNIHFINLLLFFLGTTLAVLEWPPCRQGVPLLISVVLVALFLYDLVLISLGIPFSHFDSEQKPTTVPKNKVWRSIKTLPPSARLRWEQVVMNMIVVILLILGTYMGGAKDAFVVCKAETHAVEAAPPVQKNK